jgi:hypothetical protein
MVGGVLFGVLLLAVALGPLARPATGDEYAVRRHVLLTASGVPIPQGEVSAAFKVNRNLWAINDLPVLVQFNSSAAPSEHNPGEMLQSAMQLWNDVQGAEFEFVWGPPSSVGASTCGNPYTVDGTNSITFVSTLPAGTLGITCTVWKASSGAGAPLVEFDMQINNTINWGSGPTINQGEYDLFSTILHELGHAAGLAHPCGVGSPDCSDSEVDAVMYPSLGSQHQRRELRQDDIDALISAYPADAQTPTVTPTASTTALPTTPTFVPTAAPQMQFQIRAPAIARD